MRPDDRISLDLWRADAIVLFEWLYAVDIEALPHEHRAEKQALTDLFSQLEQTLPEPSEREIAEAREAVSRDMGW